VLLLAATNRSTRTQTGPTPPQSRLVCPSMQYQMHAQCPLPRPRQLRTSIINPNVNILPPLPGDLTSAVLKLPMVKELPDTCTTCPNSVSALTVRWTMLYCDDMLLAARA